MPGSLCRERDALETQSKAAHAQLQVLEEAEGAAVGRAAQLADQVQQLQSACAEARAEAAAQAAALAQLEGQQQRSSSDVARPR